MQKIEVKDIREGDLIRCEYPQPLGMTVAEEYIAQKDEHKSAYAATYYLLDRPEPPFEPYWGMVIGHPSWAEKRAVYLPAHEDDTGPWLTDKASGEGESWKTNDWAKEKLANGWVVIEKPEDVK